MSSSGIACALGALVIGLGAFKPLGNQVYVGLRSFDSRFRLCEIKPALITGYGTWGMKVNSNPNA